MPLAMPNANANEDRACMDDSRFRWNAVDYCCGKLIQELVNPNFDGETIDRLFLVCVCENDRIRIQDWIWCVLRRLMPARLSLSLSAVFRGFCKFCSCFFWEKLGVVCKCRQCCSRDRLRICLRKQTCKMSLLEKLSDSGASSHSSLGTGRVFLKITTQRTAVLCIEITGFDSPSTWQYNIQLDGMPK